MNYKNYIFDFDGTIADTFDLSYASIIKVAKDQGISIPNDIKPDQYKNTDIRNLIKDFKIPVHRLPKLAILTQKEMSKNIDNIKLFDGISEFFEQLKSLDNDIYILTSNSKENVKSVLQKNNIDSVKEISAGTSLFGKARKIRKLLKKHNLESKYSIYFGDETRDIEACQQVGIDIAAVTWGYNSKSLLQKFNPTYLIENKTDFDKFL